MRQRIGVTGLRRAEDMTSPRRSMAAPATVASMALSSWIGSGSRRFTSTQVALNMPKVDADYFDDV